MSRENVEVVRAAEQAFNRMDLEAFAAYAHPEIEWDAGLIGTQTYRGRNGVREMLRDVQKSWSEMRMEIIGEPLGVDDTVVFEARLVARGRSTGAPVDASQFFVARFKDGSCIQARAFTSRSEALEAVGLSE
jgi:ketosteroid isomerase-like protein